MYRNINLLTAYKAFKDMYDLPGLLVFKSGITNFSIDIKNVISILQLPKRRYTKIAAVDNYRLYYSGEEFSLFDTEVITRKNEALIKDKKIILCNLFSIRTGLIVDETLAFLSLDNIFLNDNIENFGPEKDDYISWKLNIDGHTIFHLNYEKIARELAVQIYNE